MQQQSTRCRHHHHLCPHLGCTLCAWTPSRGTQPPRLHRGCFQSWCGRGRSARIEAQSQRSTSVVAATTWMLLASLRMTVYILTIPRMHEHFSLVLYGIFHSVTFGSGFGFQFLHLSFAPASVDILNTDIIQAVRELLHMICLDNTIDIETAEMYACIPFLPTPQGGHDLFLCHS